MAIILCYSTLQVYCHLLNLQISKTDLNHIKLKILSIMQYLVVY